MCKTLCTISWFEDISEENKCLGFHKKCMLNRYFYSSSLIMGPFLFAGLTKPVEYYQQIGAISL